MNTEFKYCMCNFQSSDGLSRSIVVETAVVENLDLLFVIRDKFTSPLTEMPWVATSCCEYLLFFSLPYLISHHRFNYLTTKFIT
jgi:hypothetical protein